MKWKGRRERTSFISRVVFKSRRLHLCVVNAMSSFRRLRSQRSLTDRTLTNILGPGPSFVCLTGVQYELIDLRSRENSSVNSFFHMDWMFWLHTVPCSFFDIPPLLSPYTFIFSHRIVSAVSVASPTFSYWFFACDIITSSTPRFSAACAWALSPQKM